MNCKHRLCRVHLEDFLCMCLNFFSFLSFGSSDLCHGLVAIEAQNLDPAISNTVQHSPSSSFCLRVLCTGHWVLGTTKFGQSLAFRCHPFFGVLTTYLNGLLVASHVQLPDVPGPYAPIRSIWPAIAALTPKASWPIKQWSSYSKWDG